MTFADHKAVKTRLGLAILTLLVIGSSFLILTSLGNESFWDDECFVANTARTLLTTGNLSVWDGRNLDTSSYNACYPSKYSACNPPLDSLLTAASFHILGFTNFAGRLPFALAGIAALVVLIVLVRFCTPRANIFHVYAGASLALSPCFILFSRNCRYYSLAMLLPCVIYLTYRRYISHRRVSDLIVLTLSAICLFYAHYLSCAVFLVSLAFVHMVFYRSYIKSTQRAGPICAMFVFLIATAPYAIVTRAWAFNNNVKPGPWLPDHATLLWWNFRDLNLHGILPWMASLALVGFLYGLEKSGRPLDDSEREVIDLSKQFLVMIGVSIVCLALVSPSPNAKLEIADIRYQTMLIPWMAALTGALLWFVHRRNALAAPALLAVIVCTNVLTLTPPSLANYFPHTTEFRWLLPAYIGEISHPYPTGNEAVAEFLNQNAQQDDPVTSFPQYENIPVLYYCGDKIRICCQLDGRTNLSQKFISSFHAPVWVPTNFPKWFIAYGSDQEALDMLRYFSRPHDGPNGIVRHDYVLTKLLNVYYFQTNRPEIPLHLFSPKTDFNSMADGVYIFESGPDEPVGSSVVKPISGTR